VGARVAAVVPAVAVGAGRRHALVGRAREAHTITRFRDVTCVGCGTAHAAGSYRRLDTAAGSVATPDPALAAAGRREQPVAVGVAQGADPGHRCRSSRAVEGAAAGRVGVEITRLASIQRAVAA